MYVFDKRATADELMDNPDCDGERLLRTVEQFTLINALFSRARITLRNAVLADAPKRFSIIDVGAGGGDIMRWLVKAARRQGRIAEVTCVDADPRIAEFAKRQCEPFPEIAVRCAPLQSLEAGPRYDYVFANHLLHHFPDTEAVDAVKTLARIARRRVVVSDLYRSKLSHLLFGLFAGVFFHRSFTRFDGMLSIRKGFLPEELETIARRAGLSARTRILKQAPGRLLMIHDIEGER